MHASDAVGDVTITEKNVIYEVGDVCGIGTGTRGGLFEGGDFVAFALVDHDRLPIGADSVA